MANPDHVDKIKIEFMASPFVEWVPFAESKGWNPSRTRSEYPVRKWCDEKREILAKAEADRIAQTLYDEGGRWHKEILNILRRYPEISDRVRILLTERISFVEQRMNKSNSSVDTRELLQLAQAIKAIVEAHHRALMIDRWSFELAEKHLAETRNVAEPENAPASGGDMFIGIRGQNGGIEYPTLAEFQKMYEKYLDHPYPTPSKKEADA